VDHVVDVVDVDLTGPVSLDRLRDVLESPASSASWYVATRYVIEPGHDAWVVGDEPVAGFEFDSRTAEEYAKG
jgi:hypothetical protein